MENEPFVADLPWTTPFIRTFPWFTISNMAIFHRSVGPQNSRVVWTPPWTPWTPPEALASQSCRRCLATMWTGGSLSVADFLGKFGALTLGKRVKYKKMWEKPLLSPGKWFTHGVFHGFYTSMLPGTLVYSGFIAQLAGKSHSKVPTLYGFSKFYSPNSLATLRGSCGKCWGRF